MAISRYRPSLPDRIWPRFLDAPGRFGRVPEDLLGPWPRGEDLGWTPAVDPTRRRSICRGGGAQGERLEGQQPDRYRSILL